MKYALYLFLILITGCAATMPKQESKSATPSASTASSKSTTSEENVVAEESDDFTPQGKRIYFLQHKVIRDWVFESQGMFYADMRHGELEQLMAAAEKIVSTDCANGMEVIPIEGKPAVLIIFPKPEETPLCYFAVVERVGEDEFRFFTYEHTLPHPSIYGVVGSWDREGNHHYLEERNYKTADKFVADVLSGKF